MLKLDEEMVGGQHLGPSRVRGLSVGLPLINFEPRVFIWFAILKYVIFFLGDKMSNDICYFYVFLWST